MLVIFSYLFLHLHGLLSMTSLAQRVPNLYVFGDSIVDYGHKTRHAAGMKAGYRPYGLECIWTGAERFTNGKTIPEIIDDYNSSRQYNGKKFAELLTSKLGNYLKDLYNLGARRIVIFQVGPLGCFPYIINKVKPRSRCAEDVNKLVSGFNDKLNAKLIELTKTLHGSKFVTVKTFNLIRSMIENPTDYGFEDTRWQCCPTQENGTGLCKEPIICEVSPAEMSMPDEEEKRRGFRRSFACLDVSPGKFSRIGIGKPRKDVCGDRKLYIFWDELHLTEAAYKIIVDKCFAISHNICSPPNILANMVEKNYCSLDSCMFHQY
ncbi:GDSL esterase/lipase 7 [Camellia lanceoleosa]|uniref:GDSL esterase/lipase 7 n=1 Tax=Camellia lanceoleosa TaxID=1840588 RepID=A0ACC0G463_9ERIC|nr:GDSL esterase/lipase 7 [Camellia lanceoleosa]